MKKIFLFVLAASVLACAQGTPTVVVGSGGNGATITVVGGLANVPHVAGTLAVVTDGNSGTDCTVGGGSTLVLCRYSGASWGTFSAGTASAGGSNTQLQYNNAGALGGIGQWTSNGTTTINSSATGVLDLHLAASTGFLLPGALSTGIVRVTTTTGAVGSAELSGDATTSGSNAVTVGKVNGVTYGASPSSNTVPVVTGVNAVTYETVPNAALANSAVTVAVSAPLGGGGSVALGSSSSAITCATCVTSAASLTSGQLLAGAGLQGIQTGNLSGDVTTTGSLVATVTKINGNSVPSGAGAHQLLVGTALNTFSLKTVPDCTDTTGNHLNYTQSTDAFSCGTSVPANVTTGSSLASTQVAFANGSNTITGSANFIYAATSGISLIQGANAADMIFGSRATDTTPTGNFEHYQNAAKTQDLFKVDISGNVTAVSFQTSNPSGSAGMVSLVQGTAPTNVANAINILAPTSVTTYALTLPGTVAAGLWRNSSGGTVSYAELSGDATTSGSNAVTVAKVNGVSYPTTGASFDALPILTASNSVSYFQINGGASCGSSTTALNYNATTHLFGCQTITAAAPGAGGSNTQVQFNSANALAGSANLTWVSPTLTIGAAGVTGGLALAGSTSGTTTLNAAATASGTLTLPAATDTLIGKATTDTLTNKTYDTAGTGNVFKINGTSITAIGGNTGTVGTTSGTLTASNLASFDANHNIVDSGVVAANAVTAVSAAAAAKQICTASGASKTCTYITFPETKYAPAANCVNATAGSAWSTGATPAALCRAGTNNKSGLLSPWGASDVAYVQFHIDQDADLTTTLPYLMLELTSTDATNLHTIIMQESIGCAKEDGTTTDDVAFNAARSFSTITLNGNANRTWQANLQLNSTDLTGCSAPGLMWVKVSRTTDTATNVGVYGLNLTIHRLLTSQAN